MRSCLLVPVHMYNFRNYFPNFKDIIKRRVNLILVIVFQRHIVCEIFIIVSILMVPINGRNML
jgi:hypothetical protein